MFSTIARSCGGDFFFDYKLFLHDTAAPIDLLLFLPHRGLYYGEKISWSFDEIKEASVERASGESKKSSTTRFDATESVIRQKLADVLSFDSTPCIRFLWLEHISEAQYDTLDPSFRELLPKGRIVFGDDSASTARGRLEKLADYQSEPYSRLKIIGSLNAHRLLLPTPESPFGSFLAEEQELFLDTDYADTVTTLYGNSGSGKSTLLLRKAVSILLNTPGTKVLILTPTLLAGELLRNKLVSLMDYGAFEVPLNSILFSTPQGAIPLEKLNAYEEISAVLCDDVYRMEESFIDVLKQRRGKRWLLFSTLREPDTLENTFFLLNRYREAKKLDTLRSPTQESLLYTLISELRKRFPATPRNDVIVVVPETEMLLPYKEALDEYFALNSRLLTDEFSLQYQDLDDLLLSTPRHISGLRIPHLFLIAPEGEDDYAFELSRASETATIIFFPNSNPKEDETK